MAIRPAREKSITTAILASMNQGELAHWEKTYQKISEVLIEARKSAWRAINTAMLTAYWEIGRAIVEEEQQGKKKAGYGENLIHRLSERLSKEFGKGFSVANLKDMRLFYILYPKSQAVPSFLSWTHIRSLLRVETTEARAFYEKEAIASRWSTRELDRQIYSSLFERLAQSRDKAGVPVISTKGTRTAQSSRFSERSLYLGIHWNSGEYQGSRINAGTSPHCPHASVSP